MNFEENNANALANFKELKIHVLDFKHMFMEIICLQCHIVIMLLLLFCNEI